jgi:sodium transport system permease protein
MNARDIWILYRMELRSALRERAIVVYSILLPIFLYPVMLWVMFTAMTFIAGVTAGFTSRVALVGEVPEAHRALLDTLEATTNLELTRELGEDEALGLIQAGELDALLSLHAPDPQGRSLAGNFRILLRYDGSENRSEAARARVEGVVREYRSGWIEREAEALGLREEARLVFAVGSEDVSTEEDLGAMILGLMIPLFLTIMVAVGCFYPAVDTTAGERERSTWETLMTTSASRTSVVTAKYLYVATMGVAAGLLNVAAIFVTLGAIMAPLMGEGGAISFRLPLLAIPVMMAGAVGMALLLSAGMMILAAFARTFKDGQAMIQPVYIVAILVPLLLGQQTDRTLTPEIALIPVANVAMMIRDAIGGIFLWPLIAQALLVNLAMVALCLWLARFILRFEDVLMGSFDGSFWRFAKARLRPRRVGKEPA